MRSETHAVGDGMIPHAVGQISASTGKDRNMHLREFMIILILLCTLAYGAFVVIYEHHVRREAERRVENHAQVITDAMWNFNAQGALAYLKLAVRSENYESMTVYESNGSVFHHISAEPSAYLENLLLRIGLISRHRFSANVFYKNQSIGWIDVVWKNTSVYLYLNVAFALILITTVIYLYMRILHHKYALEYRVRERTRELADSNESLQQEIADRKRVENALRESEARYRTLFEDSPISLWEADFSRVKQHIDALRAKGIDDFSKYFEAHPEEIERCSRMIRIADMNRKTIEFFSADSKEEAIHYLSNIWPESAAQIITGELLAIAENRMFEIECRTATIKGREITIVLKSSVPPGYENSWSKVFVSVHDLTDRIQAEREKTRLEAQLRQASKMEAVGTLAGGIAHDFNNILSGILGYAELSFDLVTPDSKIYDNLLKILNAGKRARDLVKHILTFSRQEKQELKPLQLKPILKEALKLLRASIPADIDIRQGIESGATVMAEPTQIHQVVMNLCTNASHAMQAKGGGGCIEVTLTDALVDHAFARKYPDLRVGRYIRLTIHDTGCGMTPDIAERIFDPFFTTKQPGKGTGMGLSVVHGIVKSHGGAITVSSRVGEGSTFNVFIPVVEKEAMFESVLDMPLPVGNEHILFVDDEPFQVDLGEQILNRLGYSVTAKTNSVEALEIFRQWSDEFDLVITDMTMPHLTGDNLAASILAIRPDIPIIICSGYSERLTEERARKVGIRQVVMKPIVLREIAQIIREVLDGKVEAN